MCRSLVEGGRRCPSDTTLARCIRGWHEPRTYAPYAGLDEALTPTVPEGADRQEMLAEARESAKAVINEFNEKIAAGDMDSARKLAIVAGSQIEQVAYLRNPEIEHRLNEAWEEVDEITGSVLDVVRRQKNGEEVSEEEIKYLQRAGLRIKEKHDKALAERSFAYRQALEDVGVEMSGPGKLDLMDGTYPKARAALNNAMYFYPQSWVEESNRGKTMMAKYIPNSRGVHSGRYPHVILRPVHEQSVVFRPKDWKPAADDPTVAYHPMGKNTSWTDATGQEIGGARSGSKSWLKTEYELSPSAASGWQEITVNGRTLYRRPKKTMLHDYVDSPYIRLSRNESITAGVPGVSTAIHEFGHRAESYVPKLKELESNFLKHRAGDEKPSQIPGYPPGEIAYMDNFPSHYMGKIYSSGHREIFTMGMEAVFQGGHGAFRDRKGSGANKEYRHFILGSLTLKPK